jgi:hypothetical protein
LGGAREGAARRTAAAAGGLLRRAWVRRPSAPVAGAIGLAAAVALTGVEAVLFRAGLPERLPSDLDWRAAGALVARDARPGDAALVSPPWAERARSALPGAVPLLPLRRAGDEDLVGVRRVWLVSLPQAPGSSGRSAADLSARAVAVDGPQRLGALEVTLYTIAAPTLPLAYLPDLLAGAEVQAGDRPCPSAGARGFHCPPSAARVAREVREVNGVVRPCILVAPDPAAEVPLAAAFPAVPIGRLLRGQAAAAGPGGAPARLAVSIDGEMVGTVGIANDGAWRAFELDTGRFAGGARRVTLVLPGAAPDAPPVCVEVMSLP